jgi:hypothetical protein
MNMFMLIPARRCVIGRVLRTDPDAEVREGVIAT